MNFKDLRNKANLTQAKLAEELYVPVATVRKWEKGKSIPSFSYMNLIANTLKVKLRDVINAFAPEETKLDEEHEKSIEIFGYLEEMFYAASDSEAFLYLISLFEISNKRGLISYADEAFPFTKIDSDPHYIDSLVLRDDNYNRVILTSRNISKIAPVSMKNNVYIFDITVNCPIFPINRKYDPKSFEQTIRITFYY